jgi:hypothetical protein
VYEHVPYTETPHGSTAAATALLAEAGEQQINILHVITDWSSEGVRMALCKLIEQ